MKLLLKTIYTALFTLLLASCYPDNGGGENEVKLVIAVDPDAGTTTPVRAMGTTYDFKVLVQSKMPPRGVDVSVVCRLDSDNSVVSSRPYTTMTSPLNVQVTNIPFNEVGTVTVTATSKTSASNTATKTFKLVRK